MKAFMIIVTALVCIVAVTMPKKASQLEVYTSNLFILLLVAVVDLVFVIKYNLYGYIEEGIQWFAVIILFVIYPSINTITLNLYARTKSMMGKITYTVYAAIIYTVCEWVFNKVGFLYYNGWKLYYSAIAYLFVVSLIELHLHIINRLAKKLIKNNCINE